MARRARVKFFDDHRGYGFLLSSDGDVFVHYTAIEGAGWRTLYPDELVEYELTEDSHLGHLKAESVRLLEVRVIPLDKQKPTRRGGRLASGAGITGQEVVHRFICQQCEHAVTFWRHSEAPRSCPRCGFERSVIEEDVPNDAAIDHAIEGALDEMPQPAARIAARTGLPIPTVDESLLRLVASGTACCIEGGYCRALEPAA